MIKKVRSIALFILNILFPKQCSACGYWGSYLCNECKSKVGYVTEQYCPRCGVHSVLGFRHERCYRSPIDQLYSICYYHDPIASLIGEIKFYPAVRCALEVIEELTRFSSIDIECPWWSDCVVIPVPLHPFRYRMRGFNQAEEIGGIISSIFNIPMESNLLKRTSFSQPQSQMSRKDRHQNVQNAFRLNPHYRKNLPSKVLLVDDVFTTGSTLREAARLLKQTKNVTHVYAFTFARG